MSDGLNDLALGEYLSAVADRTPTPGGGAVAATTLATAASLAQMAVAFSHGRPSMAQHEELHARSITVLREMSTLALELAARDEEAYGQLNTLWKLPEDDDTRKAGWDDAVEAAIAAPVAVMDQARSLLDHLLQLAPATSPMLMSDLAIAAVLADAAARAAAWNIRINLPSVSNRERADNHRSHMDATLASCREDVTKIEDACSTPSG